MRYLLIIAVLAFVIGPILWMRPNARERHLAALRQTAFKNGLRVHCLTKDKLPTCIKETASLPRQFAEYVYYRPLDISKDCVLLYAGDNYSGDHWRWDSEPQALITEQGKDLIDVMNRLTCKPLCLRLSAEGCSLIWDERGGEADVVSYAGTLKEIADKFSAE